MSIQKKFGEAIRGFRYKRGLSQEELASLSNLHRTYISSVERGQRNISIENIEKISDALGVTLSELFHEVEKKPEGGDS